MKKETKDQKFNWPIIGHKTIVKFLQKSIINNKIAHAYLFCGLKHLGKRTTGEYFAAELINIDICNNSKKFVQICDSKFVSIRDLKKHPDYYEIKKQEDRKNISIDQIRNLREKLALSSFLGGYKVALIDDAESMTEEASNALLKTLEEPKEKTVIILITNNANALPQTIVSRCQIVRFLPVPQKEIESQINHEFYREFLQIDKNSSIKDIVYFSQSRPGIVINFLENPEELTKYQEKIEEFAELMEGDLGEKWQIIDQIIPKGTRFLESQEKFQNLLSIWKSIIRDLLLIKNDLLNSLANFIIKERLIKLAQRYSSLKLKTISEEIDLAQKYLRQNVNTRLVIENLVINL